jgi:hypothetical protein
MAYSLFGARPQGAGLSRARPDGSAPPAAVRGPVSQFVEATQKSDFKPTRAVRGRIVRAGTMK